jgi:ELWxxDGT repeat protein
MWRSIPYTLTIGFVLLISSCLPQKTLKLEIVLDWSQDTSVVTTAPSTVTSVYIKLARNGGFAGNSYSPDATPFQIKDVSEGAYMVTVQAYDGDEVTWEGGGNVILQNPESNDEETSEDGDGWLTSYTIEMIPVAETDLPDFETEPTDAETASLSFNKASVKSNARWPVSAMAGGNEASLGNQTVFVESEHTLKESVESYTNARVLLSIAHGYLGNVLFYNDHVYFTAGNERDGYFLWRTDGTGVGTTELSDIGYTTEGSGSPLQLFKLDDALYFMSVNSNELVSELWKTKGSLETTELIYSFDIKNYRDHPNREDELMLWVVPSFGKAFFTVRGSGNSPSLWVTDGTDTGTHSVKSSNGAQLYSPSLFLESGSVIVFSALDSTGRANLWRTDGTSKGTTLVKDICIECRRDGALFD